MSQAVFAFIIDVAETKEKTERRVRDGGWVSPAPGAVFEIYLITNTVNGKRYIGQAWYGAKRRWREHKRLAGKARNLIGLGGAIQKHGIAAFTFEIIDTAQDEHELDDLEKQWISYYGTYAPDGRGYNLTEGGGGCRKWQPTAENLANITAANRKMHADPVWRAKNLAGLRKTRESDEWLAAYTAAHQKKVADADAADPDGAHRRSVRRAAVARSRARANGLPVPIRTQEWLRAELDAKDPDGAAIRVKRRGWVQKVKETKAFREANGLPTDGVAARDILDPEGAAKRAYSRDVGKRFNARKRGENVPIRTQRARGDANNAKRDAEDPGGARRRALQREAKARHAARNAGEPIPDLRKTWSGDRAAERDITDPAGAERRARQRANAAKRAARKAATKSAAD